MPPQALTPSAVISGRKIRIVILGYGERRERCPVADVKLLKDVMKMHFDSAVRNIQSTPNFLVR